MAWGIRMRGKDHYFEKHRNCMTRIMNRHEIEKAIQEVRGERDFDKRIKKIWDRFIK